MVVTGQGSLFQLREDQKRNIGGAKSRDVPHARIGRQKGQVGEDIAEIDGVPNQPIGAGAYDATIRWQETEAPTERDLSHNDRPDSDSGDRHGGRPEKKGTDDRDGGDNTHLERPVDERGRSPRTTA